VGGLDHAAKQKHAPNEKIRHHSLWPDKACFGGLLGEATIIPVPGAGGSGGFINLGGRIPAPLQSLGN
jgi:hypothetical protein